MRLKVLAVSLVVVLGAMAVAPAAFAWSYHLPFYKAQNIANGYTKKDCAEDPECVYWAIHCDRVDQQRVVCAEGTWDENGYTEVGEYLRCEWIEKFGVEVGGYISEHFGEPHCSYVYGT